MASARQFSKLISIKYGNLASPIFDRFHLLQLNRTIGYARSPKAEHPGDIGLSKTEFVAHRLL